MLNVLGVSFNVVFHFEWANMFHVSFPSCTYVNFWSIYILDIPNFWSMYMDTPW